MYPLRCLSRRCSGPSLSPKRSCVSEVASGGSLSGVGGPVPRSLGSTNRSVPVSFGYLGLSQFVLVRLSRRFRVVFEQFPMNLIKLQ